MAPPPRPPSFASNQKAYGDGKQSQFTKFYMLTQVVKKSRTCSIKIGSHQFKVSTEDCIYTKELKLLEVNDMIEATVTHEDYKKEKFVGGRTKLDVLSHYNEVALSCKALLSPSSNLFRLLRQGNKVADSLASVAHTHGDNMVFYSEEKFSFTA